MQRSLYWPLNKWQVTAIRPISITTKTEDQSCPNPSRQHCLPSMGNKKMELIEDLFQASLKSHNQPTEEDRIHYFHSLMCGAEKLCRICFLWNNENWMYSQWLFHRESVLTECIPEDELLKIDEKFFCNTLLGPKKIKSGVGWYESPKPVFLKQLIWFVLKVTAKLEIFLYGTRQPKLHGSAIDKPPRHRILKKHGKKIF